MKALRVILLILGILYAVAFVTNVQSWYGSYGSFNCVSFGDGSPSHGSTVAHYHGAQRLLPLFGALFCFGWLFGLTKRHIWAWYVGYALFILTIVQFLVPSLFLILAMPSTFFGWKALVLLNFFAWLTFLALKKWWIPKRREFHSTEKPDHTPQTANDTPNSEV